MDTAFLITKKIYNHMDSLNVPNLVLQPLNTVNLAVGMAQNSYLSYLSAIIGIILNLMWHLYRFYRQIKIDEKADKHDINEAPLFERRCFGCGQKFEPMHADQIFCKGDCKDAYMNDLTLRKPFIKPK
jgi:hypothetical protein